MIKFNPELDFMDNFRLALKTIEDDELAEIISTKVEMIRTIAATNTTQIRAPIISNFEALIEKRAKAGAVK